MATLNRPRGLWWSRFHFLFRFLGLTGLLVAVVVLTIVWRDEMLKPWPPVQTWSWKQVEESAGGTWAEITGIVEKAAWDWPRIVITSLLAGLAAVLFALFVELLAALTLVSGRRSAFGTNALLQAALAAFLLIAVNYYSFFHYARFDWTQDVQTGQPQFTLDRTISDQLRRLRDETVIVVYQRHKTFGQFTDKPDDFDIAAEHKVLEKVDDLVDQFREFGPRFHVERLDVEDANFDRDIKAVTRDIARRFLEEERKGAEARPSEAEVEAKAQELRHVIELAPEDSIFFFGGGKVQSLSFNDLYQLDKTASKDQNDLVMLNQGVGPFAHKVLNVEGRKPVVGVAVIHQVLSTTSPERELTLAGLRAALTARGFEVRDIVLKRWGEGLPEPGVFTAEEGRLDEIEDDIADDEARLKALDVQRQRIEGFHKAWKAGTLAELNKKFARLDGESIDEDYRSQILEDLSRQLKRNQDDKAETNERLAKSRKEKASLNLDAAAESRRMSDIKAKLDYALADCDLLIVPRMTHYMLKNGSIIQPRLYRLNEAQVAAMKDFLKQGKPIFACFGPVGERPTDAMQLGALGPPGADGLENMLSELGFRFGKETILFGVETRHGRRADPLASGATAEVPPVSFDAKTGTGRPLALRPSGTRPPNPLGESMRLVAHGVGKELDLRMQHPRPIYYDPDRAQQTRPVASVLAAPSALAPISALPLTMLYLRGAVSGPARFEPEFMVTNPDAWNAADPFPVRGRLPRFEPPEEGKKEDKPPLPGLGDDAKTNKSAVGTLEERRRDSFPIGVALETALPVGWYSEGGGSTVPVRVAAIGHGHWFTGRDLKPAEERLLVNTCNWLLGRDEYLPKDKDRWAYPRVELSERDKELWRWGTQAALPGIFAYLGLLVLLVRRVR